MNILIDRISHLPNRKPTFSCDWRISIISGNINAPITAAKITQQLQWSITLHEAKQDNCKSTSSPAKCQQYSLVMS